MNSRCSSKPGVSKRPVLLVAPAGVSSVSQRRREKATPATAAGANPVVIQCLFWASQERPEEPSDTLSFGKEMISARGIRSGGHVGTKIARSLFRLTALSCVSPCLSYVLTDLPESNANKAHGKTTTPHHKSFSEQALRCPGRPSCRPHAATPR